MKKNNLINSLFAVLLLTSPLVGADQKYPAADFQPEVVFQDSDYIAKNSQPSSTHKSSTSSPSDGSESTEVDSKYPAANFQPQVVYSDANYKHSDSSVAAKSVENSGVSEKAAESKVEQSGTNKKEQSSPNYLIGLIGLAAIGAFLFRKQSVGPKKTESKVTAQAKGAQGLTGVARYLNKTSGTGVSRYLEKQVKSAVAVTGVAKYMAKQVSSAKATATQAATGVEKYMRNRS